MKLAYKVFAITFLISVGTLSLMAMHSTDQIARLLVSRAVETLSNNVAREARILEAGFASMESDILLLAGLNSARNLTPDLTGSERSNTQADLARQFETLLRLNPAYTQVRLIGRAEEGRELVRLNQRDGNIHRVPDADLQLKQDRYYFNQALGLRPGEVYFSPVDLNRENGVIVEPYQPVLRVGAPVFSPGGHLLGVVIINIDVDVLLSTMAPLEAGGHYLLANRDGEWLHHPDPSRTFAFEFDRTDRLQLTYGIQAAWDDWWREPDAVEPIARFETGDGMLALARLHLPQTETDKGAPLVLGGLVPQSRITATTASLRQHTLWVLPVIGGFLALSLALATTWLMQPLSRLTEAANRIAAGEQEVRVHLRSNDEIGVLARDLEKMLESLKQAATSRQLAALGEMAAMVAHDLRNALSSVKVNLQVFEADVTKLGPARAQQFDLASGQVRYMEVILDDLLVFSRPEHIRPDWVDLRDVVSTASMTILQEAIRRDITILVDGVENLPRLWADRMQLIRVFRNLFANALEATPDGGLIGLSGHLEPTEDGTSVVLTLTDNGAGIPEEELEKVFEPFFTTRAKGTGLGLAIVRQMVRAHGGSVRFEAPRKDAPTGAVVVIELPLRAEEAGPEPDATAVSKGSQVHDHAHSVANKKAAE